MAETSEQVFRVTESFSFDHDGRPWVMRKGDLVDVKHPAYRYGKDLYLEQVSSQQVAEERKRSTVSATETAMAAPGKPRARTAPAPDPKG